jgi:4-aminobutyrate aminotransferase/(S)-3-amino-2-methylpropionate transaminase
MHIGEKVMAAYERLKEKYSVVGDVRGLGAMIGIEFVTDKESRTPYTEFVSVMIQKAIQNGLLLENAGTNSNVIRFLAPLVMTDEQLEKGLEIFESCLVDTMKELGAK